jgi:HEAT repeat protein
MSTSLEIPFQDIIESLIDTDTPFPTRYLYQFSDLDQDNLERLRTIWYKIPNWRRQALLDDVADLSESNSLLSFTDIGLFAVKDKDSNVRLAATQTLNDNEEIDLIPIFLKLLKNDPDQTVQAAAAGALGKFIYAGELDRINSSTCAEIENQLIATVNSLEPIDIRRKALESLGYSSREEVPALIEAAYHSQEKDWVASAIFAMGRSANEVWHPMVIKKLESNQPSIRCEAARAAGELEIPEVLTTLITLIDDPDEDTCLASIWSISQIGGEGIREILEQLYEDTEDERELKYIEAALDNLSFNEDIQLFPLFDEGEEINDFNNEYRLLEDNGSITD